MAVSAWLLFVVLAVVIGGAAGTRQLSDADTGAGESRMADQATSRAYFADKPKELVLVAPRDGHTLAGTEMSAVFGELKSGYADVPGIAQVAEPVLSKDGHTRLIEVTLDTGTLTGSARDDRAGQIVTPMLAATAGVSAHHPDLRVEQVGGASIDKSMSAMVEGDLHRAELTSLPLTLIILLVAFGALIAAGVPVLLALTAVAGALGLSGLASHLVPMDDSTSSVVLLIGMAVGVDYSLFYIRRAREERARGASTKDSIAIAAATSGRAIVVSGITVLISMAGLFVAGNGIFSSMATGTMLVVAVAMLGSVTVLPALLSLFGDKIDRPRVPLLHRLRRADGSSRLWTRVLRMVLAKPALCLCLGVLFMLGLAVPAFGMKFTPVTEADLPKSLPIVATYDRMNAAFPARGATHSVVITRTGAGILPRARVDAAVATLVRDAGGSGLFALSPAPTARYSSDGRVALVDLPIPYGAQDPRADRSLDLLRQHLIPQTLGQVPGTWTGVTGDTAGTKDFSDQLGSRLPWVFGFVLALTFLVMLTTFRSLVVAATSIVLNLLSVAAAYGLLVLVFQRHWAEGLLDFRSNGGVIAWLPLFLFVVLFGLSMDYHVFLVSRIREGALRGLSTKDAIRAGVSRSASTVTSAAVVMVAVFAIFATLTLVTFKQLGVGLSAAILLDATVVRVVLLPSLMTVLGTRNWYLPRWLEWLPKIGYEPPAEPAVAPAAPRHLATADR
jgi:RND superfamily putative drug exporter